MSQGGAMFAGGFIGLAGIIGVGKSTVTAPLAEALGFETVHEEVDGNPYLGLFYSAMAEYEKNPTELVLERLRHFSTIMQAWLLNHRFRQHREFVARISINKARGIVQDRTIREDTIFARMLNEHPNKLITDLDYNTYLDLFDNMVLKELLYPQLLIYLDCAPETALKRIKKRGRQIEQDVPLEYLRLLRNNYEQFVVEMEEAGVRILRLNWENFPPISEIVRLIHQYSLKQSSFTKWVRPLRRTDEARRIADVKSIETSLVNATAARIAVEEATKKMQEVLATREGGSKEDVYFSLSEVIRNERVALAEEETATRLLREAIADGKENPGMMRAIHAITQEVNLARQVGKTARGLVALITPTNNGSQS